MIQFAINKAYFLQALHTTRRAISSKNAIPILSTIKIEVTSDGIYLTGSNGQISIENSISVSEENAGLLITQPGSILLEANFFINVVSSLPDVTLTFEEIEQYLQNINDFKEYIELWVHEVKLPIASSKLMIYNHETDKRKLQEQINRIENYVEQVLYYIRLENSEHDYLLKKCNLGKIIHKVIKRNQDSLLFHKISIEIKNINEIVISDSKWLEFIINQIISNSIKYRSKKDCKILFNVINDNNTIALEIIDNGIGIDKKEQKYVFNKSFTGQNGRLVSSSTGMGLYITKSLCDKLGHKIKLESTLHKYTKVSIYFNDDQYYNVVR